MAWSFRRMRRRRARGFTLIELLVVISIIAILLTFIAPQVGNIREKARRTKCLNNLRVIGTSALLYADEHGGDFPGAASKSVSSELNAPNADTGTPYYISDTLVFDCPSTANTLPSGSLGGGGVANVDYMFDTALSDSSPAGTVFAADAAANHTTAQPYTRNVLFVAGHARSIRTDNAGTPVAPDAGINLSKLKADSGGGDGDGDGEGSK